jgi:hypothetical protein
VLVAERWPLLDQSALDDLLPAARTHGASVIAGGAFNSGVLADPDGNEQSANFFYSPVPLEIVERSGGSGTCAPITESHCALLPCSSRSLIRRSPRCASDAAHPRRFVPTRVA